MQLSRSRCQAHSTAWLPPRTRTRQGSFDPGVHFYLQNSTTNKLTGFSEQEGIKREHGLWHFASLLLESRAWLDSAYLLLKITAKEKDFRSSALPLAADGFKTTGHTALVITCIHRHLILCTYAITSFLKVIWNHSLGPGPWAWHMFFLEGVSGFPTVVLHCSRAYRHSSDSHSLMPYSHTSILLHYWVDTELVITKGHWNIHLLLHLQ